MRAQVADQRVTGRPVALRRRRRCGVLLGCVCLLLLSAYSGLTHQQSSPQSHLDLVPVPYQQLSLPPGEYVNVAWLPDGTVAVNYVADPENVHSQVQALQIYRLHLDGGRMRPVPLPQQPGCVRTDYIVGGTVPDGRLLAGRDCLTGKPGDAGRSAAIAVDLSSRKVTLLAPLRSFSAAVTRRPRSSEGAASYAGGQCDSLTAIAASGFLPAPRPVRIDGRSWPLDVVFRPGFEFSDSPSLCKPYGRARDAQYTADGRTIAFFASPATVGIAGRRREDVPWNLYLARAAAGGQLVDPASIRKVFTGIGDPHGMALSGDGRYASVAGDFGRDLTGTWLIDTITGRARLLGRGLANTTAFSPDERRVIATVTDRLGHLRSHLEIYTPPDHAPPARHPT
jgi:hypothetical protein